MSSMSSPFQSAALPGTCLRPQIGNFSAVSSSPTCTNASVQTGIDTKIAIRDTPDTTRDMLEVVAGRLDPVVASLRQIEPLITCVQRIEGSLKPLSASMKRIEQIEVDLKPISASVECIATAVESFQRIEAGIKAFGLQQEQQSVHVEAAIKALTLKQDQQSEEQRKFLETPPQILSSSEQKATLNLADINCIICGKCSELADTKLVMRTCTANKAVNVPEETRGFRPENKAIDVFDVADDWQLKFPDEYDTDVEPPDANEKMLQTANGEENLIAPTLRKYPSQGSEDSGTSAVDPFNRQGSEDPNTPTSPRRSSSGMKSLVGCSEAAADFKAASATETVRAMMVKQDMREMEDRHTGFSLVRYILKHLLVVANWYDQMEEDEKEGYIATMLASNWFETFSMVIIITNSCFVAVSADWAIRHPGGELPSYFTTCEYGFMIFYIVELILKIYVHRFFFWLNADMKWNWLDTVLVMVSSIDILILDIIGGGSQSGRDNNVVFMRILRIMKIAKIFRAFRAMKFVKELVMIMESLRQSMMALFWVFVMLMFMLCVFALVILQGMAEYVAQRGDTLTVQQEEIIMKHFGSMPKSMLTLYMCVTGGDDWGLYYRMVEKTGVFYATTFLFYTFFFTFALFNMLTGIFVEKTVTVATPDRAELALQERRKQRRDAAEFKHVCRILDRERTGKIKWQDFQKHMHDETMVAYMASIGLEIHDVEMFFRMVAGSSKRGEISMDRFVHGCMLMKGYAKAIDLHQHLFETYKLKCQLADVENVCSAQFGRIESQLEKQSAQQMATIQSFLDRQCQKQLRRIEYVVSKMPREQSDRRNDTYTTM